MIESPAVHTSASSRTGRCVLFAMTSASDISRSALHKAARLAAALGVGLELFYSAFDLDVIHPERSRSGSPEGGIHEYMKQRHKELWSLAEDLRATGLSVYPSVEWERRADEGIVREVLRRRPAFLVVESFGHVDYKLIETCPCPLLLIRSAQPYPSHPRIVAAVDPMHAHAKPAALDDAIVTAAAEISNALSGELHLFHARLPWATASHEARGPHWVPDVAKDDNQVAYEHGVESRVAELARCHNISCLRTHLVDGDVTECLPSYASADAADVVAIGALSRSLVQRILIGDTARQVLDQLECDVLIVKQARA
jgi:universal stress protein E